MDVVNQVDKHPLPGETIHGLGTNYHPGGKGANQAVAASLAGGEVHILGAVGTDPFANELITSLQRYGVRTEAILKKEGTSGLAFITVDSTGENNIILSAGANGLISIDDVDRHLSLFENVDYVLLQNEIPWSVGRYMIETARNKGIQVCLNPAPTFKVEDDVLAQLNILVINETEAEVITGLSVTSDQEIEAAARHLLEKGVKEVLLTLGEKGCFHMNQEGTKYSVQAHKVQAIDTTSAGDTFIGAFIVKRGEGASIMESLRFAAAASALTVTRAGAQSSIPTREEIETFISKINH